MKIINYLSLTEGKSILQTELYRIFGRISGVRNFSKNKICAIGWVRVSFFKWARVPNALWVLDWVQKN